MNLDLAARLAQLRIPVTTDSTGQRRTEGTVDVLLRGDVQAPTG